jgi:hypothetical protein
MPGIEPLARDQVRTCLDMISGEDRPLPHRRSSRKTHAEGPAPPTLLRRMLHVVPRGLRRDTPIIIYKTSGDHTQGERKAGSQRPLSLVYPTPASWHIKGRGRDFGRRFTHPHNTSPPETLEPIPLLPVCNPYCKPVQEHEQLELDVGTFCPNQYKPLCLPCTPSGLDAQTQIHWSAVRNTDSW